MTKKMPLSDFRAVRCVLEADDFALFEGDEDEAPADLIAEDVWHGIVDLPDDVAIRTSSHSGANLKLLYELWGNWIIAIGDVGNQDELFTCMLDAADCFQSATFDLLHGYYRSALANLRAALELTMIGAYANLHSADPYFLEWKGGEAERFGFTKVRRALHSALPGAPFQWMLDDNAFPAATFRELCGFTHSRPNSTDGTLWESNGPVYASQGFTLSFRMALRVYSICYLLVRIGRPRSVLPDYGKMLFEFGWLENASDAIRAFIELYPEHTPAGAAT